MIKSIVITGANGLVGVPLSRMTIKLGHSTKSIYHKEYNLLQQGVAGHIFRVWEPSHAILLQGYNGGIGFNKQYPADIFGQSVTMAINVMDACVTHDVKKVVIPLTSCGYPPLESPLSEPQYMQGEPHESVAAHATAKRCIYQYARYLNQQHGNRFICLIFNNLFGDNARWNEPERMKVADHLIKKFVDAKRQNADIVEIWGTGSVFRELMYADDAASALLWAAENYEDYNEAINIGHGIDISIRELAEIIREESGFRGKLVFNTEKPDGAKRKLLDVSKMRKLGFEPQICLREGLKRTIAAYENRKA
jgi:GDP-L-fucose synthase